MTWTGEISKMSSQMCRSASRRLIIVFGEAISLHASLTCVSSASSGRSSADRFRRGRLRVGQLFDRIQKVISERAFITGRRVNHLLFIWKHESPHMHMILSTCLYCGLLPHVTWLSRGKRSFRALTQICTLVFLRPFPGEIEFLMPNFAERLEGLAVIDGLFNKSECLDLYGAADPISGLFR
jgi:hypothetical protein